MKKSKIYQNELTKQTLLHLEHLRESGKERMEKCAELLKPYMPSKEEFEQILLRQQEMEQNEESPIEPYSLRSMAYRDQEPNET